jgi:hypothetical protein
VLAMEPSAGVCCRLMLARWRRWLLLVGAALASFVDDGEVQLAAASGRAGLLVDGVASRCSVRLAFGVSAAYGLGVRACVWLASPPVSVQNSNPMKFV